VKLQPSEVTNTEDTASEDTTNKDTASEDITTNPDNGRVVNKIYDAICIQELYPGNYNPKRKRSSYTTLDWHVDKRERPTTSYTDHWDIQASLGLFYVSYLIYREASCIFYSKNRFYIEVIDTLIPFLQDRPTRSSN